MIYIPYHLLNKEQKAIISNHVIFAFQSANDYKVKFDTDKKPLHPARTEKSWNYEMKKLYDIEYNKWRRKTKNYSDTKVIAFLNELGIETK